MSAVNNKDLVGAMAAREEHCAKSIRRAMAKELAVKVTTPQKIIKQTSISRWSTRRAVGELLMNRQRSPAIL